MDERLKPGDVVQLKSGGPEMTVTGSDGEKVRVVWYRHRDQDYSTSSFEPVLLFKTKAC